MYSAYSCPQEHYPKLTQTEAYAKSWQKSKMEKFSTIVSDIQPLIIPANLIILDV